MTTETNAERLERIKTTPTAAVNNRDLNWLVEQAAQLQELKVVKWKNGRPTVIDWNGERWIFSPKTTFRGSKRKDGDR